MKRKHTKISVLPYYNIVNKGSLGFELKFSKQLFYRFINDEIIIFNEVLKVVLNFM